MSDDNTKLLIQTLPQIIGALGTFVTAIIGAIVLYRQGQIATASTADRQQVKAEIESKLDTVHDAVNGQTERLLKVTGESEFARGEKAEFEREK